MDINYKAPIRIAYLISHPIQYQAPLLRQISKNPGFDLTVIFRTDYSAKNFNDPDFGAHIRWDTDLLNGYHYCILPAFGAADKITFWRPFNYGLWKRLRKGEYHFLWIHGYASAFKLYAIIIAKILGINVLIRDEATKVSRSRGKWKTIAKKIFFSLLNMVVDGFLAIGILNKHYYLCNGISNRKIFDMPYAVDNRHFQEKTKYYRTNAKELRSSLGLTAQRPVILFVSKLTRRKRAIDLLKAYAIIHKTLHPRPYLLFIGDGEMRIDLERRIHQLKLENDVFTLGFKNQSELPSYYSLCSVFVLPSLHEPWGLVINEAMNAGCAVIASDQVGSAFDLISQGTNGFIFKAGDVKELAFFLTEILSTPERYKIMGRSSIDRISGWSFAEDIDGLTKATKAILLEKGSGLLTESRDAYD